MVVDVAGTRLLRYDAAGKFVGIVARPGTGSLEFDHPVKIQKVQSGFVLENASDRLIWLDSEFHSLRSVDLAKVRSNGHFLVFWDFVVVEGRGDVSTVFGLGELVGQDQGPWGFRFTASAEPPAPVSIGAISQFSRLYLLNRPLLAAAAGEVYALAYSEPPAIVSLTPALTRLKSFPRGFERLPGLPPDQGAASIVVEFAAIEAAALPTQLYGHGRYLFVLTRRPTEAGETLWQLWQINPEADKVIRVLQLPTTASHLAIVPGPRDWAMIEKGPVLGIGKQEVLGLLLLPTEWIEDPESEILKVDSQVTCD